MHERSRPAHWQWYAALGVTVVALGATFAYSATHHDAAPAVISSATAQFNAHQRTPGQTPGTAKSTAEPAPQYPAQVLDLSNWYLTLPLGCTSDLPCSGKDNEAAEILQPSLATFSDAYFHLNDAKDAAVFRADVDGVTTSGSSYPRSELREMINDGTTHASWSTTSGVHVMVVTEAVTHLPVAKAQVVTAQIHNDSSDVLEIIANGPGVNGLGPNQYQICARFGANHGKQTGPCLDTSYQLGAYYTLVIESSSGKIRVWYAKGTSAPDTQTTSPAWQESYSGDHNYFKVGAYTQSNLQQGDQAGAYGEVAVRNVSVTHR